MNQATRHMTPDAWLGVPLQLAIRDLAVVNGYAGALSVRTARRGTDAGRNRPLAVASVAVPSHGFTLLFRPLAAMEPNSFTALVTDRTGNIVWQEDTDHPSYYEAYDLARRAFARLRRFEREDAEPSARREGKENPWPERADGFELDMPDGSVARGYRAPGIHGTLPEGWRVYDIMECDSERWTPYPGYEDVAEADREDGENGRYETSLVIDDNPGPHFVDQGDPFVTRHDLSGVDWEFDEGHCGYDGVQLSDDIARLAAAAMPVMESARTESPIR